MERSLNKRKRGRNVKEGTDVQLSVLANRDLMGRDAV
jgi:hypothetical protein